MIGITVLQMLRRIPMQIMLCLLIANTSSQAQSIPSAPRIGQSAGVNLDHAPTRGIVMGSFLVTFEQGSLNDVVLELLRGSVHHRGDAGDSVTWLCYTIISSQTNQRLWIISDGEMGGSNHRITAIDAVELAKGAEPTEDCPTLPTKYRPLTFDNHLWLGSSTAEVQKALGGAAGTSSGWWSYPYQGTVRDASGSKPIVFDVTSSFEIKLMRGRISAIRASQITTN